jgi:L-cysteine desulfidase
MIAARYRLVDCFGRPITSKQQRRDEQVEGFELPNGAIISKQISFDLHKRIQNDTALRERLETAQRMTGRSILHLAMLDHGNKQMTAGMEKAIEKNLDFGEKIQQRRIKEEKLTESEKGYENLSVA